MSKIFSQSYPFILDYVNPLTTIVSDLIHWQNSYFSKYLLQFLSKNSGKI